MTLPHSVPLPPVTLSIVLRSALFWVAFFLHSFLCTLAALATLLMPGRLIRPVVWGWARGHRALCRNVLRQTVRIEGDLPASTRFIVMKHEAMFETIDAVCLLPNPVVPAKRELFDIPLWGFAARRYGLIPIEREGGAKALRGLLAEVKHAIAQGRPIVFFPEGTRVHHGEAPPLRSGFAALYALVNEPVVPIALDVGRLWPRTTWLLYPGTITYKVGQTVPPGLPRAEAETRMHAAINALNHQRE